MDKSKFQNKEEWRKFGIGLGIILLVIATIQFIIGKGIYYYFCLASAFVFFSVIALPIILKPIFILFSYIGLGINWVVTRVILGLLLFLVFTPLGFFLKLSGKDFLSLKINKKQNSYWLKRKVTRFKKDDFEKQF